MNEFPIQAQGYRSVFKLYSEDGKRIVDVLEFRNGETYLDEQEMVEGTTPRNRHWGKVGRPIRLAIRCGKIRGRNPLVSRK
ncbi:hypothetical protein AB4851_17355 [Burkholderia sp. 22PA0099]|uniref:hypothetical protein n=1 Tax=Burkholderia sp. 22PA0099 TaxID=3237372 RepID=UPI0039C3AA3C